MTGQAAAGRTSPTEFSATTALATPPPQTTTTAAATTTGCCLTTRFAPAMADPGANRSRDGCLAAKLRPVAVISSCYTPPSPSLSHRRGHPGTLDHPTVQGFGRAERAQGWERRWPLKVAAVAASGRRSAVGAEVVRARRADLARRRSKKDGRRRLARSAVQLAPGPESARWSAFNLRSRSCASFYHSPRTSQTPPQGRTEASCASRCSRSSASAIFATSTRPSSRNRRASSAWPATACERARPS